MSYDGKVVEVPMMGGLTGTKNQSTIHPDQLLQANNVSFASGALSKEGGAVKYNSTAIIGSPNIIAGHDWFPTDAVQRMIVVLSDGTIKKDSGAFTFPTTLASALTVANTVPMFVEGAKEAAANNRKLFIFTGKNAVQVLSGDGVTTTALLTPPADWSAANQPVVGAIHEFRLWGAGNLNDPHRVYYSTTGNHEDMTGAGSGSITVYPGEGEKIVGMISFKGLLLLWKYPKGLYYIDTTDPTIANWKVRVVSRATGGVSPLGQVLIDNDIIYLDAAGNFQLVSATLEFGNMAANNLSQKFQINSFLHDNVNLSRLQQIRAMYYGNRREVHFLLSSLNSTVNNRRMVIDFNMAEPRFRFSDRDTMDSIWLRMDIDNIQRPMIGDNAGFVWFLDQDTKSKAGAGYLGQFQTPQIDLSHLGPSTNNLPTKRKQGQFLEVVAEPKGNWNLNVDIQWDGVTTQTVTFNMGTGGVGLGTFVIGTDTLGGDTLLNRKRRITGGGRRFSLIARNNGVGEDFSIDKFYLHFVPGDERLI